MHVDDVIRSTDEPLEDVMGQHVGIRAVGVAGKAPVQVLSIRRHDEGCSAPEGREVDHRHRRDGPSECRGVDLSKEFAQGSHARVLAAMNTGQQRQPRPRRVTLELEVRQLQFPVGEARNPQVTASHGFLARPAVHDEVPSTKDCRTLVSDVTV